MPFTEAQIKALSAKLSAKHVKTREHAGLTLSYIEGWHVIAEANRTFGFDSWDRETVAAKCVWEGVRNGRNACAYMARVRIRVRAGDTVIIREGSGSGHGTGLTPGEAHESALKQAETDAMKRALATFGNPFGLALYDKEQHGVRRTGARNKGAVGGQQVFWVVLSSTGEPTSTHGDPVEYCSALRRMLETIKTAEEAKTFWARNRSTLVWLRKVLPQLKTDKEKHYADILGALYKRRLRELTKQPEADKTEQKSGKAGVGTDKVVVAIPRPRRVRDKEHLRFVASQPCLVCARMPSQAHHVRFAQPRAFGRKVSDEWVVPLCITHHRGLHDAGDEESWWKKHGSIDPIIEAERLWRQTRPVKFTKTSKEPQAKRRAPIG